MKLFKQVVFLPVALLLISLHLVFAWGYFGFAFALRALHKWVMK